MSADLRLLSTDAFYRYELHEKSRIHEAFLARQTSPQEMHAQMVALGNAYDEWLKARLRLCTRGYIPVPQL